MQMISPIGQYALKFSASADNSQPKFLLLQQGDLPDTVVKGLLQEGLFTGYHNDAKDTWLRMPRDPKKAERAQQILREANVFFVPANEIHIPKSPQ